MNKSYWLLSAIVGLAVSLCVSGSAYAQDAGTQAAPAHVLVTVEARHGKDVA